MKFSQHGICFSPSIWTKFKFGFNQVLKESSIYNFPIYEFWSLLAFFGESCKGTGAHATDRGRERAGATSHVRASTRRRRAASVRRRTMAPRSPRMSVACVSPACTSRMRPGRWARAPRSVHALAAAPSVRPPRKHAEGHCTPRLNASVASLRSNDASVHLAIKSRIPLLPRVSPPPAARHCHGRLGELPPPLAPAACQPSQSPP
jgi:hypothetical protein